MANHTIPRKAYRQYTPEEKAEVLRLIATGLKYREINEQTGIPLATISRIRNEPQPAAVDPEHTNGIPLVYQTDTGGLPESATVIPGIPIIPDSIPEGRWREAIESRLDVIESFIMAAQQRTHGIPILPESKPVLPALTGTPPPTKKHSFVIALDLLERINAYADTHHLEIKSVLDMALRQFFAGEVSR